jgi:hypothetical protein
MSQSLEITAQVLLSSTAAEWKVILYAPAPGKKRYTLHSEVRRAGSDVWTKGINYNPYFMNRDSAISGFVSSRNSLKSVMQNDGPVTETVLVPWE